MVSRFVAEARAVNQIRHRNIIDIFAFGALEDGRHYYVMEFLDGAPLDQQLEQGGAIPFGEAIPILRAVARALDAAHAKGIAHRDLKPENIFLARESDGAVYPKLLDFGIAKLLGATAAGSMHKTRTGAPIGTPYYMSPEQCRGRDVDHRTDIYAFGVVAYKVLTGEVPFDGDDYMDILLKQIGEEPVPPSQVAARGAHAPALPPSVDDAIAWMMKKDPAQRPPNLISAMRALEDAAVAAGVPFSSDAPTGVHATQSSPLSAQRTPSAITPMPRALQRSGLGNAQTMDAGQLAGQASGQASGAIAAVGAATPGPGTLAPPRRSSRLLVAAIVGAVVAGVVVFLLIRSTRSGGSTSGGTAAASSAGDPAGGVGPAGAGTGVATATGAGVARPASRPPPARASPPAPASRRAPASPSRGWSRSRSPAFRPAPRSTVRAARCSAWRR